VIGVSIDFKLHAAPSLKSLVELFKARGFLGQSPEPLVATSGTPKRSANAGRVNLPKAKRETLVGGFPVEINSN
jgi:hypothetical protein